MANRLSHVRVTVMASFYRSTYQQRLFLLVLLFAGVLTGCFVLFQHHRERLYKAEELDARLQLLNLRVSHDLQQGNPPEQIYNRYRRTTEGLRLTLIDSLGSVFYDSERHGSEAALTNHLSRSEVTEALDKGEGHTIRRHSEAVERDYFYSARLEEGIIVRTALPYDWTLAETLSVDSRYLWYMVLITLLMLVAGYLVTSRLAENILRLRWFTEKLDRGEEISNMAPFPDDELGEVSNHIVDLYGRLQRALADGEREHATALREEQEKIRIKRQLTNNISHELKTPVSALRGYLETILMNPTMEEETRTRFIEKSYQQTERLQQLLQDISLVTRMEEAPHLIDCEELNLRLLIEEATCDLPVERGSSMAVMLNLPDELPIRGNGQLLHSIFHNLAENALAYSGGTELRIELLNRNGEHYRFCVADNGSGVEEQHLGRLFERFYRVDKGRSRKLGGTGLGLSIVKNAVLFHGGHIEVRNRPGGGLEFIFSLCSRE